MEPPHPSEKKSLDISGEEHIDRICLRFEDEWKSGAEPRIEGVHRMGATFALAQGGELGIWQMVNSQECRQRHVYGRTSGYKFGLALHPNGRLLAFGEYSRSYLWDAASLRYYRSIENGGASAIAFDPNNGDLITGGKAGSWRWPIRRTPRDEAKQAVKINSRSLSNRVMLGIAYYRIGNDKESVQVLQSISDKKLDDDFRIYKQLFLAMAYQRSGQTNKAQFALLNAQIRRRLLRFPLTSTVTFYDICEREARALLRKKND